MMRRLIAAICVLAAACGGGAPVPAPAGPAAVTLLFGGDVMLGRGSAGAFAAEGVDVLAPVRHLVAGAGLAAANLESPLTRASAATDGHDLRADPAAAGVLAAAGFDAMALANNHAGDGGPRTVADSLAALRAAGVVALGAGNTAATAIAPAIVRVGDLDVALLAVDLTGGGPAPGPWPGVAGWDAAMVQAAIADARRQADVVAVGIHGGAEGLPRPDPVLRAAVDQAGAWGADVVWAHGAHRVYETAILDDSPDGRPAVAAYGLGDLVFDRPGAEGALLEVLAGRDGVRAWRVGRTGTGDGRVAFAAWEEPPAAAVALGGEWWALVTQPRLGSHPAPPDVAAWFDEGVVVAAAGRGDVTGDGVDEVVVAFRRPQRPTLVNQRVDAALVDPDGRTAHVGVYDETGGQIWVAGTLARPVAALAVCDGGLAVAYATLAGEALVATGAWRWDGFGFAVAPDLPGAGEPGCADVDGDGGRDPAIDRG